MINNPHNKIKQKDSFCLIDGFGRVIISAPHSVEHTRNGEKRPAEFQTGVIAQALSKRVHCPVIFKTFNENDDANYDLNSKYKKALCRYIQQHSINVLIDLHQLALWREENIDIGTGFGNNVKSFPELPNIVKTIFENNGFDNVKIDIPFGASKPYTVAAYVANKCSISCLQIEINSRFFDLQNKEYNLEKVIQTLETVINQLNGMDKNGRDFNN